MPKSAGRLPSINGLRAFSIAMVLIDHLSMHTPLFENLRHYHALRPVLNFMSDGHLGVNVFFVISGFLITKLMMREEASTDTVSLKGFYIRRTLRIFPAYYFLLFCYFAMQVFHIIHINGISWLSALTYTKYFNWREDWFTSHAWSLSIEEHFYLFWPLIFVGGLKVRKYTAFLLVIAVPLIRVLLYLHPISWMNELTIFTRIDAIATGCLFAIYRKDITSAFGNRWRTVFYVSACSLFFLRYFPALAEPLHLGFIFIPLGITHGTVANLLIGIILLFSVFGPSGLWFRFLNLKIMHWMGMLSYSIYLWQQVFIRGWQPVFAGSVLSRINQFPLNLLFILIMALFSYHVVEKPFLKLKSGFAGKKPNI